MESREWRVESGESAAAPQVNEGCLLALLNVGQAYYFTGSVKNAAV
ncbi:MAG: hypothetical protein ACI4F2_01510 [Acutalibacteraceae bacterium]